MSSGELAERSLPVFHRSDKGLGRPYLLAVGYLLAAGLASLLVLIEAPGTTQQRLVLSTVAVTAAVATTVPTGLLLITHYRLGGRRADVDAGIIVLVAGALWLLPARLGPLLSDDVRSTSAPFLMAVALAVLALSGTATPVRARRNAGVGVVDRSVVYRNRLRLVALSVVALTTLGYGLRAIWVDYSSAAVPLSAAVLGMAAVQMLWSGYRAERWSLTFIGMELLGMQFSELISLHDPVVGSAAWLAGDLFALTGAIIGTLGALAVAQAAAERVRGDLVQATVSGVRMLQAQASTEEALHDLRSGLLAVEAFAGSLNPPNRPVKPPDSAGLELLTAELARLRELVTASSTRIGRVDLADGLTHVVATRPHQPIDLSAAPDAVVLGRRSDVLEMVQNLLDNAAAHAPGSPVEIVVDRRADAVMITVADRGPGFNEELLPHAFDRGVTSSTSGTGLGLHIVRRTAEAMGGSVLAKNRPRGGAMVQVSLPAAPRLVGEPGMVSAGEIHV